MHVYYETQGWTDTYLGSKANANLKQPKKFQTAVEGREAEMLGPTNTALTPDFFFILCFSAIFGNFPLSGFRIK